MASHIKSVFSAQWPDHGNDCYVEPIVLFETKQPFRRSQQQSTHGLHLDTSLKWLEMKEVSCKDKLCGLVLVCNPLAPVQRASFVLRVQRLAVSKVKVSTGLTVNGEHREADVTFTREGQSIVIAHYVNDAPDIPPLAVLNSMSSVLAFGRWDKIPS